MNAFVRELIGEILGNLGQRLSPADIIAMLPDILRIIEDASDGDGRLDASTRGVILLRVDELIGGLV